MPLNAPIMKISACRKHGADVHVNGADLIEVSSHNTFFPFSLSAITVTFFNSFEQSKEIALQMAKANGLAYING